VRRAVADSVAPTRRGQRRIRRGIILRRIRALLAGGLVLGVGATATLASWNDREYATATFTSGKFDIVGSVNNGAFGQHPSAGNAATLTFAIPTGTTTAMVPGNVAYALFSVRTTAAADSATIPGAVNSVAGAVQLTANANNSANGTLGQYLTYRVHTISGTSCTATTFAAGAPIIPASGAPEGDYPLSTSAVQTQPLAGAGADQVNYCFAITLPPGAPNEAQGLTLNAGWTFVATT